MLASILMKKKASLMMTRMPFARYMVLASDPNTSSWQYQKNQSNAEMKIEFDEHDLMVLKKMLSKMNVHAERHQNMIHNIEEDEKMMQEEELNHKNHEKLKEVFNKHGVPINRDFFRDLKNWKRS